MVVGLRAVLLQVQAVIEGTVTLVVQCQEPALLAVHQKVPKV